MAGKSALAQLLMAGSRRLCGQQAGPAGVVGLSSKVGEARRGMANIAAANDDTPLEVEIPVPYKVHKIEAPTQVATTSPKELIGFFAEMFKMRRMEIAADALYKAKLIRGFCHLYDGQEAVCVGMEAALTFDDCIITSYRDHCTHLGRGGTVLEVIGELMGRVEGASLGKGGSMHMYRKQTNFYGGNGIVGAQVPLGAGLAFAQKYSKTDSVTMALYGDGAANQGQVFEAMNIAALWNLPVIFTCENNHYGMGTAEWRAAKSSEFYCRGDYVPGIKVDGMDVLAVKHAVKFAKEYVLANGPLVMEMDTYRYHGHSMSDPGSTYRTREEITGVRQERDPIERVRKLLLAKEICSPAEIKVLEKEAKALVDADVEKAKSAPIPPDAELYQHVYVNGKGLEVFSPDRKQLTVSL